MRGGARRYRISPLQYKGIMVLVLVLITESVTLTKAVQLWSTVQQTGFTTTASSGGGGGGGGAKNQKEELAQECYESSSTTATTTCSNTPSSPVFPPIPQTLGKISKRITSTFRKNKMQHQNHRNCCTEFHDCVSRSGYSLQDCTLIPRGGHGVASAAAEAAKEAVVTATKMPYNIPLNGWKVIFQALLTTLNVVCWLVPLRSKKISDNKLALSLANAFSGGVFLSLAFGHLIPECVHGFHGYNEVTPYLLVLSGYLLIFFVEKVAFDAHEILHEMEHAQDRQHQHGHDDNDKLATSENGDSAKNDGGATSGRSALILLGALAVHSILEMAALGLADTFGDSAILTLSIALHQVSMSYKMCFCFHLCYSLFG
jgi:zinc transporter 1/2/3